MAIRSALRRRLGPCLVGAMLATGNPGALGQPRGAGPAAGSQTPAPAASAPPPAAFAPTPGYAVKPSDVVLPPDVPVGQYRRTFRPFPNWTLICDENLVRKQRVCNIAQTILGPDGGPVFSWSLAANQGGEPLFIIRVPPGIGVESAIRIEVPDGGPGIAVPVSGCDAKICLAYLPAANRLRAAVSKGLAVRISYAGTASSTGPSFLVPLEGLAAALAAI